MTAATPGISACCDIGEPGLCGGRCDETGATPWRVAMRRWRRRGTGLAFGGQRDHGDGDAGNGAHRGFRLGANTFPGAGLGGIDIDREKHLAVVDRYRRQHIGIGQGDAARRRHLGQTIENLLLRHAHSASPDMTYQRPHSATHRAAPAQKATFPTHPPARRAPLPPPLLGGLVVQFDHHAIGVVDEDLPELAARNLPRVERHPPGLKPLLHGGKTPADESDVMDNAGIRLLRLIRR